MTITTDAYIPAHLQLHGRTRKVRLIVMHATQSKERVGAARATAAWFANPDSKGSAHITNDNLETIESVKPENVAAGAPGANQDGYHIEQVGYSEQGEVEWLDAYSEAVIARSANSAREACEFFDIPKVWLSVQDVRDGKAGITDHNTITKATGKGTHWDPGPYWPRGRFMALVLEDDDMPLSDDDINKIALKSAAAVSKVMQPQLDALKSDLKAKDVEMRDSLARLERELHAQVIEAISDSHPADT